ncbi:MAG: hypothetical protein K2X66_13060 [Cyanobacteria bacterium]|nr:hypothetical protein [Cyanobacteriota bacterium]
MKPKTRLYFKMRTAKTGNNLVEYILPAALVGLVILGTVVGITNGIQSQLAKEYGISDNLSATNQKTIKLRPMGTNPYLQTVQLDLGDGKSITLSNFPVNPVNVIETDGVSGNTFLISKSLKELANKLKAVGEINNTQFQSLIDLANQGFQQAGFQKFVEDALAKSNGDVSVLKQETIQLNGKTVNLQNLVYSLGFLSKDTVSDSSLYKTLTAQDVQYLYRGSVPFDPGNKLEGGQLGVNQIEFLTQYQKARDSGALSHPVVEKLIGELSFQIYQSNQIIASSANTTASSGKDNTFFKDAVKRDSTLFFSNLSTQNSKDICIVGGGKDLGKSCTN